MADVNPLPDPLTPPAADPAPPRRARRRHLGPLVHLLRPVRWRLLLLAAFTVAGGLAEAAVLVVVAQLAIAITDIGTVESLSIGPLSFSLPTDVNRLFTVAAGLVALRLVTQLIASGLAAGALTRTQTGLRKRVLHAFVAADWRTQASEPDGYMQELMTSHVSRTGSAVGVLSSVVSSAVNFLAMICSALLVAPATAATIFVSVAVLFVVFRPLTRLSRSLAQRRMEAGHEFARVITETVHHSLEIRTTNVGEQVSDELDRQADEIHDLDHRTEWVHLGMPPLYQALAVGVLLGALATLHTAGSPEAGALGAVLLLLLRGLSYSQTLQSSYHRLNELAPSADRVLDELTRYEDARQPDGDVDLEDIERIELDHVNFRYLPDQPTLTDVSVTLERGQMLGVIGPSGAGKSTLIQLLLGLRAPDAGRYLVNGRPYTDYRTDTWFERVAFVPQEPRLISGTVRDNIRYWRDIDDERIEDAARRAHIHDDVASWPDGYDTDVGPRGSSLSGGQKQRVAIARALATTPDVLILDEPTSALDLRSEGMLERTFAALKGQLTFVVIAHRLSTVSACDRLLVLDDGEVEALGTPAEITARSTFYREALARTRAGIGPDDPDGLLPEP